VYLVAAGGRRKRRRRRRTSKEQNPHRGRGIINRKISAVNLTNIKPRVKCTVTDKKQAPE
jgi:hypothetical protein